MSGGHPAHRPGERRGESRLTATLWNRDAAAPPKGCTFPCCTRGHYALELCMAHYRMQQEKGFLLPLTPAVRLGEQWTPAFGVAFATALLAYHAPDRLSQPYRAA